MSPANLGCAPAAENPSQNRSLVRSEPPASRKTASTGLDKLQTQHDKLLAQVQNKKAVLAAALAAFEKLEREYAIQITGLEDQIREIREAIKKEFEFFTSQASHLSKRDRSKLRRLQAELFEDEDDDDDDDNDDDSLDDEWLEEPPLSDYDDFEPDFPRARSQSGQSRRGAAAEVPSANKPENHAGLIRSLFRRLTLALHPDKVQDESEQKRRTSIMQEITGAYQRGDVAGLLALEKQWLGADPEHSPKDTVKGWMARLRQANTELRRQLKAITAELKELTRVHPELAPGARKKKAPSRPRFDPVLEHLREVQRQAQHLLNLALAFRAGEISTTRFINAHYTRVQRGPDVQDLLDDLLDDLQAQVGARSASDRVHRRPSKKASKKKR